MWFDAQGDMFVFRDTGSIYRVDVTDLQAPVSELVSTGTEQTTGDAAHCTYRPSLTKTASPSSIGEGGAVTFTFEISNALPAGSIGDPLTVDLDDVLPAGMAIDASSISVTGAAGFTDNTTDGTNILDIDAIDVPANSTVTITVDVDTASLAPGEHSSRATISGLPVTLGESVDSDDPSLPGFDDPTAFTVIARPDACLLYTSDAADE